MIKNFPNKDLSHLKVSLVVDLFDLIQLDSEDRLVVSLFDNANDEIRSHGVFWLSQSVGPQKPGESNKIWDKVWDLWQWRMDVALAAKNKEKFTQEISDYLRLLKHTPLDLGELYDTLKHTLAFMHRQGFGHQSQT